MKNIMISLRMLVIMIVLTGAAYPLLVTGVARVFFRDKAEGSVVMLNGKKIGSKLIGQKFASEKYFWGRPSAADYETVPSGASNLAPTSKALSDNIRNRKKLFGNKPGIPEDLLFSSGSGLDPDITPEAAIFQIERIAGARHFDAAKTEELKKLVSRLKEKRDFFILGEDRINVLSLNIALDKMDGQD
jgi:potassium-transporting ATPase KdpC subunit